MRCCSSSTLERRRAAAAGAVVRADDGARASRGARRRARAATARSCARPRARIASRVRVVERRRRRRRWRSGAQRGSSTSALPLTCDDLAAVLVERDAPSCACDRCRTAARARPGATGRSTRAAAPPLAASVRSAPSVGSPMTFHDALVVHARATRCCRARSWRAGCFSVVGEARIDRLAARRRGCRPPDRSRCR